MIKYDWHPLRYVPLNPFLILKAKLHLAAQNVALVGIHYAEQPDQGTHNTLSWIPGLWRMAGHWVKGTKTFRSSLSLTSFELFLVDKRLNTLGQFSLIDKKFNQSLLWLEEQMGSLDLGHQHLSLKVPYKMKGLHQNLPFDGIDLDLLTDLGAYYHNTFILFRNFRAQSGDATSEIRIWPQFLNQTLNIIVKESGDEHLDTYVTLGYMHVGVYAKEPCFYVKSWPHTEVALLKPLPKGAHWNQTDWTGALLPISAIWDLEDQQEFIFTFYKKAFNQLKKALLG
jgi:hypothetical protein